ncbi:HAD family hydrolase [Streptomyces sp. NPDC001068]|uniref:HAD family hydrolase n=1 Tax=Streptomyces sp. NPDC001068 TaxID=3364544 RepID=UPI00369E550B
MTSHSNNLVGLITRARYVLLDFDGPICRLFAGHAADHVSRELVRWLEKQGADGLLTDAEQRATDPWDVLRAVDRRHPSGELVVELEERLTQEELLAACSAEPTPYADGVVRAWAAKGVGLAVTTNNSPAATRKYLGLRGLETCFGIHVHGRTSDLSRLKPHPDCLERALAGLDADPSEALMIGDAPSDLEAASSSGVRFVGYVRNPRKREALLTAGADPECLVSSMAEVLTVLGR